MKTKTQHMPELGIFSHYLKCDRSELELITKELLEAAKDAAAYLNDVSLVTRNPSVMIGLQAHRDILLAAIAKAEGR